MKCPIRCAVPAMVIPTDRRSALTRAAGFRPRDVTNPRHTRLFLDDVLRTRYTARGATLGILVLSLLSGLSCMGPVRSGGGNGGPSSSPVRTPSQTSAGRRDPAGTSPTGRLSVNGETLEADKLWRDLGDDLSTNARTLAGADYRHYVERRAAQLITDKIAETLLYQQASRRIAPEMNGRVDALVDAEVRKIVATEYGGVERRYEKHLTSQGRTLDDVREVIRRQAIISSYLEQEVRPKVAEPTRAELVAAFQAGSQSLGRPERRRMSLIEVRVRDRLPKDEDNPTRKELEAARRDALARVETAQIELASGRAFPDVARRYSDGLHATEGGAWGWVTLGSVRKRFEPAVGALYGLAAGDISDVVKTEEGFFLVRCDEIDPGLNPDFETVQPVLKERLFRTAYNRRIVQLVAELRGKARMEPADLEGFHAAVVEAAPNRTSVTIPPAPPAALAED